MHKVYTAEEIAAGTDADGRAIPKRVLSLARGSASSSPAVSASVDELRDENAQLRDRLAALESAAGITPPAKAGKGKKAAPAAAPAGE